MKNRFHNTITESNCNYWLSNLYRTRDHISKRISAAVVREDHEYEAELEQEYQFTCDEIERFLEFRRTHECLLEGDPGYGPV